MSVLNTRNFVCWFLIFCSIQLEAQKKFSTGDGKIHFVSKAELELIKASSNKLKGVIDPATNQFAFSVVVPSFLGFNSELQREHFNEIWKAKISTMTFTGKIIEQMDFSIVAYMTYVQRVT
jgi:hypothetical protein